MGLFDNINGINEKIEKAEVLYRQGLYKDALNMMDYSDLQIISMSKEQFCETMFLSAKCFDELGEFEAAIRALDRIINYPGYNNSYISRAEELKKEIQKYR